MMNKDKLRSVIAEHGENQRILADALGISRVTLSRKINERRTGFSLREIGAIVKRYGLSEEQITEVFFANVVS